MYTFTHNQLAGKTRSLRLQTLAFLPEKKDLKCSHVPSKHSLLHYFVSRALYKMLFEIQILIKRNLKFK